MFVLKVKNLSLILRVGVLIFTSVFFLQTTSAGVFSSDITSVEVTEDSDWPINDEKNKTGISSEQLKNYNDSCQSNRPKTKDDLDDWRDDSKKDGGWDDGWGSADDSEWGASDDSDWGLNFQGLVGEEDGSDGDWGDGDTSEEPSTNNPLGDLFGDISFKSIVNVGKQIWKILDDGKPTLNFRKNRAHALPKGVVCWQDLHGWKAPVVKPFQLIARTARKKTLFKFKFRVVYMYGGSVNGKGQFLTGITVIPDPLVLKWGKKLDVRVQVPEIANFGDDSENPVAGAVIEIGWKYNTTFRVQMGTQMFFVRGDSPNVKVYGKNDSDVEILH